MQRAGTCAGFTEVDERGRRQQKRQHCKRQDGEHTAFRLRECVASFQGIALIEEEHADQDAAGKARQTQQRVQIAARKSENHAERAAQEHQASDHDKHAEHKARDRRAAAARRKFFFRQRHQEASEHQTDDLRTDVLDCLCRVKPKRTGGVAQEAGNAEAHVFRVSEQHQQRGNHADDETGEHDVAFFVFEGHINSPFRCSFARIATVQEKPESGSGSSNCIHFMTSPAECPIGFSDNCFGLIGFPDKSSRLPNKWNSCSIYLRFQ